MRITRACLTLGLVLVVAGCTLFRGPQKAPSPAPELKRGTGGNPVLEAAEAGREPKLSLYINETGEVKDLFFEEYIQGVVAREMKTDWPVEALAAQAIMARTFTLATIRDRGGVPQHGTDASTSVEEFQAYDASAINDRVREAVKMTRGKVATYQGQFIRAWFSAYAGDVTATAKEGLAFREAEPPYIASVENPGIKFAPAEHKKWSVTFTKEQIRAAVVKTGSDPGPVETVTIAERGPAGRAMTIKVNSVEVPGADFRIALGSTELKSIYLMDIGVSGNSVTFTGQGYGHGVGMCQWGANGLAQEGKGPEEIVTHYFEGVEIEKLWD